MSPPLAIRATRIICIYALSQKQGERQNQYKNTDKNKDEYAFSGVGLIKKTGGCYEAYKIHNFQCTDLEYLAAAEIKTH